MAQAPPNSLATTFTPCIIIFCPNVFHSFQLTPHSPLLSPLQNSPARISSENLTAKNEGGLTLEERRGDRQNWARPWAGRRWKENTGHENRLLMPSMKLDQENASEKISVWRKKTILCVGTKGKRMSYLVNSLLIKITFYFLTLLLNCILLLSSEELFLTIYSWPLLLLDFSSRSPLSPPSRLI